MAAMDWQSEGPRTRAFEEISPKPGHPHTHTVIFLHGRGDDAHNFMKCLQGGTWVDSQRRTPMDVFPTFRWVFPTAGMKPCARPGGPRAMSQWFDMWDHLNLRYREEMQAPGLREGVGRVRELIATEAGKLGGRYDRIVLMGISQGGATSVHTLLNLHLPGGGGPRRLGAFVGVACRMPFPERSLAETRKVLALDGIDGNSSGSGSGSDNDILRNTPIMLEHCADDPTVLVESGKQLRQTLEGFGASSLIWREYPNGGHWFKSPEGLDDLAMFLNKVLSTE